MHPLCAFWQLPLGHSHSRNPFSTGRIVLMWKQLCRYMFALGLWYTLIFVTWVWGKFVVRLHTQAQGFRYVYLCVFVHMWGGWSREDWWCNFGYVIKNLVLSGINAGCLFLLYENINVEHGIIQLLRPMYRTKRNIHAWYYTRQSSNICSIRLKLRF